MVLEGEGGYCDPLVMCSEVRKMIIVPLENRLEMVADRWAADMSASFPKVMLWVTETKVSANVHLKLNLNMAEMMIAWTSCDLAEQGYSSWSTQAATKCAGGKRECAKLFFISHMSHSCYECSPVFMAHCWHIHLWSLSIFFPVTDIQFCLAICHKTSEWIMKRQGFSRRG